MRHRLDYHTGPGSPFQEPEHPLSPDAPPSEPKLDVCMEVAEGVVRHAGTCDACHVLHGAYQVRAPSDRDAGPDDDAAEAYRREHEVADLRAQITELQAALRATPHGPSEELRERTIEECARVADKWVSYYPTSAFPEDGESRGAISAGMARHVASRIASELRALLLSGAGGEGETNG